VTAKESVRGHGPLHKVNAEGRECALGYKVNAEGRESALGYRSLP